MLLFFLTTGVPLLVAMLLVGCLAWQGNTLAMSALVFLTFVWLRVDKHFEGPHVFRINQDHGLVISDLVGLLILLGAALAWLSARRNKRRTPDQPEQSVVGS